MTDPILRRIQDNFAGAVTTLADGCGGHVIHEDGLLLYASASPSPFPWNGAVRTSGEMPAAEIVSRSREFFGEIEHGFSLGALEGLDDDLIKDLGEADDTSPEMTISHRPSEVQPADGSHIEIVDSESQRLDWIAAVGEAFETLGESPATWSACYPDLASVSNPKTVAMTVYDEGRPAAGGMYYRSGRVIEVLHIGTANAFRRRGHGRAVATALTIHGLNNGATMASLQAEAMGFETYRRIGYETVSTYHWYVNPVRG